MAQSVTRALRAIKRHGAAPEQIDHVILSAINVTLCLSSRGDDRVSEGFNLDVARNGRGVAHFSLPYCKCEVPTR
jgi:hypothetical protein